MDPPAEMSRAPLMEVNESMQRNAPVESKVKDHLGFNLYSSYNSQSSTEYSKMDMH